MPQKSAEAGEVCTSFTWPGAVTASAASSLSSLGLCKPRTAPSCWLVCATAKTLDLLQVSNEPASNLSEGPRMLQASGAHQLLDLAASAAEHCSEQAQRKPCDRARGEAERLNQASGEKVARKVGSASGLNTQGRRCTSCALPAASSACALPRSRVLKAACSAGMSRSCMQGLLDAMPCSLICTAGACSGTDPWPAILCQALHTATTLQ